MKIAFSAIATILAFISLGYYLISVLKGKTKPHVYTWLIWAVLGIIGITAMIIEGAGIGVLPYIVTIFFNICIVFAGLKYGIKEFTRLDNVMFGLAITALISWYLTNSPSYGVMFAGTATIVGAIPTLNKSWTTHHLEPIGAFATAFLKHILAFLALEKYVFATWFKPIVGIGISFSIIVVVLIRKNILKTTPAIDPS